MTNALLGLNGVRGKGRIAEEILFCPKLNYLGVREIPLQLSQVYSCVELLNISEFFFNHSI